MRDSGKIQIGVVEDEILTADAICDSLIEMGYEPLEPVISYGDAIEMLESVSVDLLLIDIQLSGRKSGIDLATKVQQEYKIPFIFLSSNIDQVNVNLVKELGSPAFLSKPFRKNELFAAIELAIHNDQQGRGVQTNIGNVKIDYGHQIPTHLYVKKDDLYLKLEIGRLLFLKSEGHYIDFYVNDGKRHTVRGKLKDYEGLLSKHQFQQTHRSYIVNLNCIDAVHHSYLLIRDNKIPIARNFKDDVMNCLGI